MGEGDVLRAPLGRIRGIFVFGDAFLAGADDRKKNTAGGE
jgi:hypothetical protein